MASTTTQSLGSYQPLSSAKSTPASSAFTRLWSDSTNRRARESILGQLDRSTLLSLRLTSRACTKPAAPHTFKDVEITFKSTTFTKPARLAALARVGQYVRRLTFRTPSGDKIILPPLLEPTTGSEVEYVYTPSCQSLNSKSSRTKLSPSSDPEGAKALNDILVKQYPPLYHAAVNVGSFVRAFGCLPNLKHLTISCSGSDSTTVCPTAFKTKSIVDLTLISLRMAIERASLPQLSQLTIAPISPNAIQYLNPVLGPGARPNSLRRWRQIRALRLQMPVTIDRAVLKILHAYIGVFSGSLKIFNFTWLPGPAEPRTKSRKDAQSILVAGIPLRPSSTGSTYFPRVLTPEASELSWRSDSESSREQRGPNPLTLHICEHLKQEHSQGRRMTPKEKTSASSLPSLQSMTSASTLSSVDSRRDPPVPSTAIFPPPRTSSKPQLRCSPPTYPLPGVMIPPHYHSNLPSSSSSPSSSTSSPSSTHSSPLRPRSSGTSPISSPSPLTPLHLPNLTFFSLENISCRASEISTFISGHGRHLSEFKFEATTLTHGDWDAALAPLTALAGGDDAWKREARREEEVPLCLGPELSPVRDAMGGLGTGGLVLEAGVVKKSPWLGGKSPFLGMAMGMGKPKDHTGMRQVGEKGAEIFGAIGLSGSCGRELGLPWERRVRKANKSKSGGQKALEDGVRKLLAQTVFPWF